jgi:hypothetical protein
MSSLYPPSDDVIARCDGLTAGEVSAHVTLSTALGQRWGGESTLVFSKGRVWALTRGSVLDPWQPVTIEQDSLSLVADGWQQRLHLRAVDGVAYEVEVSSLKADDLARAISTHNTSLADARPSITGGSAHRVALGLLKAPQRLLLSAIKAAEDKLLRVLRAKARAQARKR